MRLLLLQAGVRPTLMLRHPDKLDKDAVLRATEGADTLFWVDPPIDDEDPIATYARAGAHAAAAIERHKITRTVFQSSVGAEKRSGAGEIDGLGHTEELLDAQREHRWCTCAAGSSSRASCSTARRSRTACCGSRCPSTRRCRGSTHATSAT